MCIKFQLNFNTALTVLCLMLQYDSNTNPFLVLQELTCSFCSASIVIIAYTGLETILLINN